MINKLIARQGDLSFIKLPKLPTKLKKIKGGSLLHSDTTTHTHLLTGGTLYKDSKGNLTAVVSKSAKVTHEEHGTINLGKGIYEVRRQRQFSSSDMSKPVID